MTATRAPRTIRADAQKNRDAILAAARETFEREGVLASLDGIAARAGVGNATLYRNFPTRDHLLAAVMEANTEAMLAEAQALPLSFAPREALAEWLFRLTWQLRIWHDLPSCVASAGKDAGSSMNSTTARLLEATGTLLEQAASAGQTAHGVAATDVFELLVALSWAVDRYGDGEPAARRRVAIATAGIFSPR
jgi:AcrR family transcriptional regulator